MPKNAAAKSAARAHASEQRISYADARRRLAAAQTVRPEPGTRGSWEKVAAQFADVTVGDRLRFVPKSGRVWWTIRARDERFLVATAPAPFHPTGTLWYSVVDLTGWDCTYNGVGPGVVRSSLNTLGGGWSDIGPDGTGCQSALDGLASGRWSLSRRRVCQVEGVGVHPDDRRG